MDLIATLGYHPEKCFFSTSPIRHKVYIFLFVLVRRVWKSGFYQVLPAQKLLGHPIVPELESTYFPRLFCTLNFMALRNPKKLPVEKIHFCFKV